MLKVFEKYACQLGLVVACFVIGCGGCSGFDGPVGTVSGKVSFQGKPLPAGASVIFKYEETGQVATGTLSTSDGSFRLRWRGSYDVLASAYKVALSTGASTGAATTVPTRANAY
jgi:hypothetical protein